MDRHTLAMALVSFLLLVCGSFFLRWAIYSSRRKLALAVMVVLGAMMLFAGVIALLFAVGLAFGY